MLWEFIGLFTDNKVVDEQRLVQIKYDYYLVEEPLKRIFLSSSLKPEHAGMLLGRTYPNGFVPSTTLLQLLVPHSARAVTLNEKGAWLFICGRDIFSESIMSSTGNPQAHELVLVLNAFGECLGVGRVVQKLSARGLVVKHELDIGWFVRKKVKAIRLA